MFLLHYSNKVILTKNVLCIYTSSIARGRGATAPPLARKQKKKRGKCAFRALTRFVCSDREIYWLLKQYCKC